MHLLKKRSVRFYLGFILVLAMAIGGSAIAAFADSGSGTATLVGGNLSVKGTYGGATFSTTLTGQDLKPTYSLPMTVTDATGTGAGWHLQIDANPQLTCTTGACNGATLAQQLKSVDTGACAGQGTCTAIQTTTAPAVGFTIGTGSLNATSFFSDDASHGLGIFTVNATVTVLIPGNSYAGAYAGTIELAAVSGP